MAGDEARSPRAEEREREEMDEAHAAGAAARQPMAILGAWRTSSMRAFNSMRARFGGREREGEGEGEGGPDDAADAPGAEGTGEEEEEEEEVLDAAGAGAGAGECEETQDVFATGDPQESIAGGAQAGDFCKPRLIWSALCDADAGLEREFRSRVLAICTPSVGDVAPPDDDAGGEEVQMQAVIRRFISPDARELPIRELTEYLAMGGDMLVLDERLKYVRFKVVPRYMSEEVFWQRYFGAVHEEMRNVRVEEAIKVSERMARVERRMTERIYVGGPPRGAGDAAGGDARGRGAGPSGRGGDAESGPARVSLRVASGGAGGGPVRLEIRAGNAVDADGADAVGADGGDPLEAAGGHGFEQYVVGLEFLSETGLVTLEEALGAGRAVRSMREFGKLDGDFGQDWRNVAVGGGGAAHATAGGRVMSRAMQAGRKLVRRFAPNNDESTIVRVMQATYHLFDARAYSNPMGCGASSQDSISYYIGGAPPDGFVVWLATHMALCPSPREMAFFWAKVINELRWHWKHKRTLPRMPKEEFPDVRCCLIHQQLMLLNGCIARCQEEALKEAIRETLRKRRARAGADGAPPGEGEDGAGEYRRGALRRLPGLVGDAGLELWEPETQRQALLTETQMRETQEMQMKHASTGHGAAALLSDIQAFKAANPGCTFVDFVRWYSPADYNAAAGALSRRMEDESNMWRELFSQAKPVPVVDQVPIFDAELAGEEALQTIVDCPPSDLMEQLLTVYVSQIHCSASISEHASEEPLATALQESGQLFEDLSGRGMSENRVQRFCHVALQLLRISNEVGLSGGDETEADDWVAL